MSDINPNNIQPRLLPVGTKVQVVSSPDTAKVAGLVGTIVRHRPPVKGRPANRQYPYAVDLGNDRILPFNTREVKQWTK